MVDDPAALEAFLDDSPSCVATRLALADLYWDLGSEAWSRYYRWSALTKTWPHFGAGSLWYWFEAGKDAKNNPTIPPRYFPSFLSREWAVKLGFRRSLHSKERRRIEEFLWRGIWGKDGPPQGLIDGLMRSGE